MGDLENRKPEDGEDNKVSSGEKADQKDAKGTVPMRTYVIMALAGIYVAYLGYSLCSSVIKGADGSSPGFMVAGIVFLVLGVVFVLNGIKGYVKITKAQKEQTDKSSIQMSEDEADTEVPQAAEETGSSSQGKKMSIADRANLVSQLGDVDEDEE